MIPLVNVIAPHLMPRDNNWVSKMSCFDLRCERRAPTVISFNLISNHNVIALPAHARSSNGASKIGGLGVLFPVAHSVISKNWRYFSSSIEIVMYLCLETNISISLYLFF